MNDVRILDASALLCLVLNEPGAAIVQRMLPSVAISAVNLSEVVMKLLEHGIPLVAVETMMASFGLRVEPFSTKLAFEAAGLRDATRSAGLSLGDRACLATARHLGGTAVTADRSWTKISDAVGIDIELIR